MAQAKRRDELAPRHDNAEALNEVVKKSRSRILIYQKI